MNQRFTGPHLREKTAPMDCHELRPHGSVQYLWRNRLEPALEPAVQRVVRRWLPMSAMRSQRQHIRFVYEAGVPTRAIPSAVAQIFVARQRSPSTPSGH